MRTCSEWSHVLRLASGARGPFDWDLMRVLPMDWVGRLGLLVSPTCVRRHQAGRESTERKFPCGQRQEFFSPNSLPSPEVNQAATVDPRTSVIRPETEVHTCKQQRSTYPTRGGTIPLPSHDSPDEPPQTAGTKMPECPRRHRPLQSPRPRLHK